MASVLSGIRVVDLSWGFAGSLTTMVLADYGADVVKVEPPEGDPIRRHPAFPMWFRGKRSVVLDQKRPEELRQLQQLAAGADVVLQTYRPGVAERLGLAYDDLSKTNPGLIHASITAMGTKGPYAHLKGYEGIAAAKIGAYGNVSGMAPRPGPSYAAVPWASTSAAHLALHGILAALYVRERTGKGQAIETTLAQGFCAQDPWMSFIDWLANKYPDAYKVTPLVPTEGTPLSDYIFRLLVAMTKDGRWLQFSQTSPHLWNALVKALNLEEVISQPMFKNAPNMETFEDSVKFWDIMVSKIRERTLDEWQEHFKDHPDVGAEIFRTPEEGLEHPQMLHNGHVIELDDPRVGKTRQLAPLVRMDETPGQVQRPAPNLGEHTEEVLRSLREGKPQFVAREGGKLPVPKRPLEGVTILELSLFYASPFGTTLLADLGARVIKLEPKRGDDIRYAMPIPETGAVKVLQGKESVAVDLETPEGQKIAHELVKDADLVMMGFRGGVAKRMHLDYETFRKINPSIIYLNAPGYGIDGPYARKPAYAPTIGAGIGVALHQAGAGVTFDDPEAATLEQIKGVSVRLRHAAMGPGNADGVSAKAVATALLLGLVARERTGKAQQMLTSMVCSTAYANSSQMIRYEGKPDSRPDPELYGTGALYRLYETADGWVFLACPQEDEWRGLCEVLAEHGKSVSLADDPRFADRSSRTANDAALAELLAGVLTQRSAGEWEKLCTERDVACVEVAMTPSYQFTLKHPVMLENGFVDEVEHPTFGRHPRQGPLVRLSLTPGVSKPGVAIGQQTQAVLEELGYSREAIDELDAKGIIRRG